jgi:hypothetical protein
VSIHFIAVFLIKGIKTNCEKLSKLTNSIAKSINKWENTLYGRGKIFTESSLSPPDKVKHGID